jgi:hypothetical protein
MASPPSPPTPPNCTDAPPATVTPTVPAGNAAPATATSISGVERDLGRLAGWPETYPRSTGRLGAAQNRILPTCRRWVCGKYHGSLLVHRRCPWMDAGCRRAGAAALSKAPPDGPRVPLAPVNDASQPWHGRCPGGERQPRPDATGPAFPTYRGTATWHDKDGYWRHDTLGISPYSNRSNCASKYRWPLSACK